MTISSHVMSLASKCDEQTSSLVFICLSLEKGLHEGWWGYHRSCKITSGNPVECVGWVCPRQWCSQCHQLNGNDRPGDKAEVSRTPKVSWDEDGMASEEESWKYSGIVNRDGLAGSEVIVIGTVANGKTKGMGLGVLEKLPAERPSRTWNWQSEPEITVNHWKAFSVGLWSQLQRHRQPLAWNSQEMGCALALIVLCSGSYKGNLWQSRWQERNKASL